jgi:translation elongation factor EF-4
MQLDYSAEFAKSFAGLLAHAKFSDIVSKVSQSALLKFGYGAKLGTADNQVNVLSANTDKFAGVIVHQHVEDGLITDQMPLSILKKGRIWVKVDANVVKGDAAFVRVAGGEVGVFRNAADGVNTIAVVGTFFSSANSGELAILELNIV